MTIAHAVRNAVAAGQGDRWASFAGPSMLGHVLHVAIAQGPDGFDPMVGSQLAKTGQCFRARFTHIERRDGTFRPWLIETVADNDRRVGKRQVPRLKEAA